MGVESTVSKSTGYRARSLTSRKGRPTGMRKLTQELLGWRPKQPAHLIDFDRSEYFKS
jgi:hypothetical protein